MYGEPTTHQIDVQLKEDKMETPVNVFTPAASGSGDGMAAAAMMAAAMGGNRPYYDGVGGGLGAGAAGGLGAGILGGLLGGMVFGGNGFGGNRNNLIVGENPVTPTQLTSGLAGVISANNQSTLQQSLGDIKAAIPLAEGQMQLALAGAQADINSNISAALQVAIAGQAGINKNISDAIASSLSSQSQIKDLVLTTGAALGTQILTSRYELAQVTRDDGDKTRALIASIQEGNLQRQLTLAETALIEQRQIGRTRDLEVNVTQTVNQNQLQLQAQQQQQQQLILLSQIAAGLANVTQIAHATNSNIIAGNTGAVATGPQSANPVNVNA